MKLIPLTQGQFAMVDDKDFDYLSQWKWYAAKSKSTFYVHRKTYKPIRLVYMHRLIMGLDNIKPKLFADHKDGNGLNNQRSNLRIATRSQNNANKRVLSRANFSSKYFGVSWFKSNNVWTAKVEKNRVVKYFGSFDNEIDAALAYNEAAKKIHGEFATLNKI